MRKLKSKSFLSLSLSLSLNIKERNYALPSPDKKRNPPRTSLNFPAKLTEFRESCALFANFPPSTPGRRRRRRISIRGASSARERACARPAADRGGIAARRRDVRGLVRARRTRRRGRVRRVGTSGVRASRKHTAGRGQAGPRTGDGRAVVLLILGRRGATHSRRGRACWREVTSSPRRRGPPRRHSFSAFLFFFTSVWPKPESPDFSPAPTVLFAPRARSRVLLPSSRDSPEPAGGCVSWSSSSSGRRYQRFLVALGKTGVIDRRGIHRGGRHTGEPVT